MPAHPGTVAAPVEETVVRGAWRAIVQTVPLALYGLVAVRLSYRARRAAAETAPPAPGPLPTPPPPVSIVLPVRDEEANIAGILASLLAQDYPAFDITVIDDGSTDATPRLLAAWAARDPRVRVGRVAELPAGWAGKAHALHTGVGLTTGEWLLFTDADTRHAPDTLRRMVAHADRGRLDLLSMFTRLLFTGAGHRLLTPIGALTLIAGATPGEVRDPGIPRAFANGQYILIQRAAYVASGGYAAPGMRETFADDVFLAELVKRAGGRLDVVGGRDLVTNEQWATWDSVWRGWRKSAYGTVVRQPLAALGGGLALIGYGALPLAAALRLAAARHRPGVLLAAAVVALQIDARAVLDREFGLPPAWSLTAPLGWAALGVLVLDALRLYLTGRGADWKGRRAPVA